MFEKPLSGLKTEEYFKFLSQEHIPLYKIPLGSYFFQVKDGKLTLEDNQINIDFESHKFYEFISKKCKFKESNFWGFFLNVSNDYNSQDYSQAILHQIYDKPIQLIFTPQKNLIDCEDIEIKSLESINLFDIINPKVIENYKNLYKRAKHKNFDRLIKITKYIEKKLSSLIDKEFFFSPESYYLLPDITIKEWDNLRKEIIEQLYLGTKFFRCKLFVTQSLEFFMIHNRFYNSNRSVLIKYILREMEKFQPEYYSKDMEIKIINIRKLIVKHKSQIPTNEYEILKHFLIANHISISDYKIIEYLFKDIIELYSNDRIKIQQTDNYIDYIINEELKSIKRNKK